MTDRPRQQAGAEQQDRRQRDLSHQQPDAPARPGGRRTVALRGERGESVAGRLQRGRQPRDDGRQAHEPGGDPEDQRIRGVIRHLHEVRRGNPVESGSPVPESEAEHETWRRERQAEAERPGERGQHCGFHEELTNDAGAARAERQVDRDLTPARDRARQQQVAGVRTRQDQHQDDGEREQRLAPAAEIGGRRKSTCSWAVCRSPRGLPMVIRRRSGTGGSARSARPPPMPVSRQGSADQRGG